MPRTALFLFVVFPVLSFFRYMYGYVVEYLQPYREHSTAQHSTAQSPLHKAANQVRADQSRSKEICAYMHAGGVRVVFLEHGALGIRKSPVCT